ncbi:MAG: maleylpyruvate isomerase N-terminal domain-containing protein [Chloroflexi bacterium]|nr:maleylpyruvate isomerase N-terminal domain-containing protein [Chloroflexota bacterium]
MSRYNILTGRINRNDSDAPEAPWTPDSNPSPQRRDNRERFETFCRSLSAEELARPIPASHWRVIDYISHLASIDLYVGPWFEAMAEGRKWAPAGDNGDMFSIDVWNDARIGERKDHGVETLLAGAARHRADIFATFERFGDEALTRRFDFHDRNISFVTYLRLWAGHDPAHTRDMLAALPERAHEPSLTAWLSRYNFGETVR